MEKQEHDQNTILGPVKTLKQLMEEGASLPDVPTDQLPKGPPDYPATSRRLRMLHGDNK